MRPRVLRHYHQFVYLNSKLKISTRLFCIRLVNNKSIHEIIYYTFELLADLSILIFSPCSVIFCTRSATSGLAFVVDETGAISFHTCEQNAQKEEAKRIKEVSIAQILDGDSRVGLDKGLITMVEEYMDLNDWEEEHQAVVMKAFNFLSARANG